MSPTTFAHEFDTECFKGKVDFPTGVFIDGQFSAGSEKTTIEYVATMSLVYIICSHLAVSSTLVS